MIHDVLSRITKNNMNTTTDGNNEGFVLTEFHVRKEFLTDWMHVNSREYFQFIVKI